MLLRVDNTTAIAYVNKIGGVRFPTLQKIAKDGLKRKTIGSKLHTLNRKIMWKQIWNHVDYNRKRNTYSLSEDAFKNLVTDFVKPHVDLFASRVNTKCPRRISWKKDPGSLMIDAFMIE